MLKRKQKEFPNTTYVFDKQKLLVKKWGMGDDSSDFTLLKNGKILYYKSGKVNQDQTNKIIKMVNQALR